MFKEVLEKWKLTPYVKIKESDLDVIKKYLSSLGFGIISNWLRSNMSDDIRSSFTRLMDIKKGMLKEMIERCEET